MTTPPNLFDPGMLVRSRELCREVHALASETRKTIAQTRRILAGGRAPAAPASPPADEPDDLCRLFDSLIEACRHADADGDAETVALIERLVMHVGGRIDRRLAPQEAVAGLQ